MNYSSPNEWQEGLCGCCSDPESCLLSWCCPCFQFGQNAMAIDGMDSDVMCCSFYMMLCSGNAWILNMIYRMKMRQKFGIEGSCITDCLASFCCGCCTLAQGKRELDRRAIAYPRPNQYLSTGSAPQTHLLSESMPLKDANWNI
eukprot:TRINITY_DN7706_c0_g1_i1.p1 TRINITY_DN7706_c0_g1~~TRINITY_DN7706_c0_g1_i1.p1  ORF type:complete len:158 (+),score=4.37 TRINITY_DN7706_c0_g1_i1:45-476(+)